jgi:AAA+ ATPase superfamily predicted ATPase
MVVTLQASKVPASTPKLRPYSADLDRIDGFSQRLENLYGFSGQNPRDSEIYARNRLYNAIVGHPNAISRHCFRDIQVYFGYLGTESVGFGNIQGFRA